LILLQICPCKPIFIPVILSSHPVTTENHRKMSSLLFLTEKYNGIKGSKHQTESNIIDSLNLAIYKE